MGDPLGAGSGGRAVDREAPGTPAPEGAALGAEALRADPNPLAPDYSCFGVAERLLLSGHSHQAWPDRGFEGQVRAWKDAAEHVDEKWSRAFARAERVREGYRRLLGGSEGPIALGPATHDLLMKWLSALPLRERPRLVSTDLEFHALRRQLDRLAEAGVLEVEKVPALPAESVAPYVQARQLAVLPLDLGVGMESFGIVRRRSHLLSPAAQKMLDSLRTVARRLYGFADMAPESPA